MVSVLRWCFNPSATFISGNDINNNVVELLVITGNKNGIGITDGPKPSQILKVLENRFEEYWENFEKFQRKSTTKNGYIVEFRFSTNREKDRFIKKKLQILHVSTNFVIYDVAFHYEVSYNSVASASVSHSVQPRATDTLVTTLSTPKSTVTFIEYLSIVTLNCNRLFNTRWENKGQMIIQKIKQYDIICLQDCECTYYKHSMESMFPGAAFFWHENARESLLIIIQCKEMYEKIFAANFDKCQQLKFTLNRVRYELWNVYVPQGYTKGSWPQQFVLLLNKIEAENVILAGDWNAVEDSVDRRSNKRILMMSN